jgi:hypothetical protein
MLFSGILTAVGLVAITAKFSRNFLERVLGYDWAVDLLVTLGLPILFIGTYSGVMTAVVTGLAVSFILWITKNLMGYQTYSRANGWERHQASWTPIYLGEKMHGWFKMSLTSAVDDFKRGWKSKGEANAAA